ncbi:MAG: hypothetical protein Fues2KO_52800 [Fuerstiella sp.]
MFLPHAQIMELQSFARVADAEARTDLSIGMIRDENDYTSTFTGGLRRNVNANSQTGLRATSLLLQPSEERASGTDAAIILIRAGKSKVALFEAKWPRFNTPGYKWDKAQGRTGKSHFSNQITRQSRYAGTFAVFEMFYCEYPFCLQPSFLEDTGSSCTWFSDAEDFRNKRPVADQIWTQADLQKMLTSHRTSISDVMIALAECREGIPIPMNDPQAIAAEFGLTGRILVITGEDDVVEQRRTY